MKSLATALLSLFLLVGCLPTGEPGDSRWVTLFDGESLDGWTLVNGDIPFEVRNGELVGATALTVPTRYLATTRSFSDFVLELEVNNSRGDNSGVQFRSTSQAPWYSGLTGYQLEIDPSSRGWSGGIYFEGVGQWRYPIIRNPGCTAAWRAEDWNTLRIETRGAEMRTFVNEIQCAHVFDDLLAEGVIGLQVHSIGNTPERDGLETRWRNIRIIENPVDSDYTPAGVTGDVRSWLIGRLSPHERQQGWRLVGNGGTHLAEWNADDVVNPIDSSSISTTSLVLDNDTGTDRAVLALPGDNYHLVADFRMSPATRGEIRYRPSTTCEASFRIFDDTSIADPDPDDPGLIGSLTGVIAAENLSETVIGKRVLHTDAWQRAEIVVQDGRVEHWLNAVKVVEFEGCAALSASVPVAGETLLENHVSIQLDHGKLRFHTIKFRPL